MNRILLILLALLVLLGIGLGIYLYTRDSKEGPEVLHETPSNPFEGLEAGPVEGTNTLLVELSDDTLVPVPDFTKQDQPEWAGEAAGYQVAGSETGTYQILYIPPDQYGSQAQFLVTLLKEPLGETRLAAEAELRAKLQRPDAELCKLDVYVSTYPSVNETYAGGNLGLSFCPGAVPLP